MMDLGLDLDMDMDLDLGLDLDMHSKCQLDSLVYRPRSSSDTVHCCSANQVLHYDEAANPTYSDEQCILYSLVQV